MDGISDEDMRRMRAEVGRRAGNPGPMQDVYRRLAAVYDGNALLDPDAAELRRKIEANPILKLYAAEGMVRDMSGRFVSVECSPGDRAPLPLPTLNFSVTPAYPGLEPIDFDAPREPSPLPPRLRSLRQRLALFIAPWLREE